VSFCVVRAWPAQWMPPLELSGDALVYPTETIPVNGRGWVRLPIEAGDPPFQADREEVRPGMSDDTGWYADPRVPGQSRWWDGSGWTTRTMPVPDASAPAVTTLPGRPVRRLPPSVDESTSMRALDRPADPAPSHRRPIAAAVGGWLLVMLLALAMATAAAAVRWALPPFGGPVGQPIPFAQ